MEKSVLSFTKPLQLQEYHVRGGNGQSWHPVYSFQNTPTGHFWPVIVLCCVAFRFVGVWSQDNGKYNTKIQFRDCQSHSALGCYFTEEEAARVYDKACIYQVCLLPPPYCPHHASHTVYILWQAALLCTVCIVLNSSHWDYTLLVASNCWMSFRVDQRSTHTLHSAIIVPYCTPLFLTGIACLLVGADKDRGTCSHIFA